MSFDIFLGCFLNGKPSSFPKDTVEKAFGRFAAERRQHCWVLRFPNGGRSYLYLDDDDNQIEDFNVNRPAGSPELWRGIWDILRQTSSVLYWPGGGCIVGHASVTAHLPLDMIKALGTPAVATDPQFIPDFIERD
jgi:hypothetical protein